ncbi:MAG: tetratricopeptide repeat protein [Myxococcota bacterium]
MSSPERNRLKVKLARLQELRRWREVAEAASGWLQSSPRDAFIMLYLGEAQERLGQLETAVRTFEAAIEAAPNDHQMSQGWWWLSRILDKQGKYSPAFRAAQHSLALAPADPWSHVRVSEAARRVEKRDVARRGAEKAVECGPTLPKAWANLGRQRHWECDMVGAEAAHRRALELAPDTAAYIVDHGRALLHLRRYDEAIERYQRAALANPTSADGVHGLVYALEYKGNRAEAIHYAERAAESHPNSIHVHQTFVRITAETYPSRALEIARLGVERFSQRAQAWVSLARVLQQLDADEEALGAAEQAIAVEPENDLGHLETADVLLKMGRLDAARQVLKARTKTHEDSASLWRRLAELVGVHNPEVASHAIVRAIELSPDHVDTWISAAHVYTALGDRDEAQSAFARLQAHSDFYAWQQIAWLSFVAEFDNIDAGYALGRARKLAFRVKHDVILDVIALGHAGKWKEVTEAMEPAFANGWLNCEYLCFYAVAHAHLGHADVVRDIVRGRRIGTRRARLCLDGACLARIRVENALAHCTKDPPKH